MDPKTEKDNQNNSVCSGGRFEVNSSTIKNIFVHVEKPENVSTEIKPISRFRKPDMNMKETKKFKSILNKVKNEENCILHCSGVSGSGKSQILRKLAEKFPFYEENGKNSENAIKWHIQCKDSGHDVTDELKKLTDELLHNYHITDKNEHQSIKNSLAASNADNLINALSSSTFPVLIMIEDPDPDKNKPNNKLLQDLLMKLYKVTTQTGTKPNIHVYISSTTTSPIVEKDETEDMEIYYNEAIEGFEETEALEYLAGNKNFNETEQKAATTVFNRFSGLPLGLQAAKISCDKKKIEYSEYLELLEDLEESIIEQENKAIGKKLGENAIHVLRAIILPFKPNEHSNEHDVMVLEWKVLLCLSCLNYDRIPRSVLENCFHLLRASKVKNPTILNKADAGELISKLLDHRMCSETDEGEITFHEVVFNAIRVNQPKNVEKSFNPLEFAIQVMSGLASKDLSKKDHSKEMHKIRRHLECLLDNIEKGNFLKTETNVICRALASHLYETTAAIILHEAPASFSKKSEKYFKKALKLIWEEEEDWICKAEESLDEQAKAIVEKSREKGKYLPTNFLLKYVSQLKIYFDSDEVDFLRRKLSTEVFKEVEDLIKSKNPRALLMKLQQHKLVLSNSEFSSIFYAERVASILHSYSRHVLYTEANTTQSKNTSTLRSLLSNSIAVECRKKLDTPLLTERLSQTGGLIEIALKVNKQCSKRNFKARKFCQDILSSKTEATDMYENGMLKEVFGPSKDSTRIKLLRSITRVNSRLLKLDKSKVNVEDADKKCNELFELAVENCSKISNSIMCIVYCAKYYAASHNIEELEAVFKKFFQIIEEKSQSKEDLFRTYAWGAYNYARAVYTFPELYVEKHVDGAFEICKRILNDKKTAAKKLEENIRKALKELEELQKVKCPE